jgi:2-isopropylmalate synthase
MWCDNMGPSAPTCLYNPLQYGEIQCLTTWRIRRLRRRIGFSHGTLRTDSEFSTARIFDTTLRDGEQSPRTSFSYDDKRAIATALDGMGVHVIEAGFPVNSDAEFRAVSDIATHTDATTCGLARVVDGDVEAALDSGVDMIHIFASTSEVQLADSMHATREEVIDRSVECVRRVAETGTEVMFSPMDATRTDHDYLTEVVEAVSAAGVDWVNIPDTCGVATPGRFADLVELVGEHTDARIDVHTHDDFGLASANALAGYEAGADQAQVSVNGIGERAGNAAFEQVAMAAESVYGADTGIDTTGIAELATMVEERSVITTPANAPVVGDNAFSHESGIHAAGVLENSATFEPGVMTPEMVGAEREFVLGKHTGTHSVEKRLREVGYDPTDAEVRAVTRDVKEFGATDQRVTDERLAAFADDHGVARADERVTEGPA